MPTGLGEAVLAGAGIQAGGGLLSGIFGSGAAKSAAAQQQQTARQALALQQQMFGTIEGLELPFILGGQGAFAQLQALTNTDAAGALRGGPMTGALTAPFQPTMEQLSKTPGYQFTLGQGLQGVQNSFAAQGLGSSGAALKGATNYAEGLASTTFQQQFQNYLQQNAQIANILGAQSGIGASAGSTLAGAGVNLAGQSSGTLGTLGAAGASGTIGSANALLGGIGAATSSIGGALPAFALAPLTTAALANLPGMYNTGNQGPGLPGNPLPTY